MTALIEAARRQGIAGFTAGMLADNEGMLRVFRTCGYYGASKLVDGVYVFGNQSRIRTRVFRGKTRVSNFLERVLNQLIVFHYQVPLVLLGFDRRTVTLLETLLSCEKQR